MTSIQTHPQVSIKQFDGIYNTFITSGNVNCSYQLLDIWFSLMEMFIYLSVEWHVALVSTFFGNVSANSITVVSILLSIFYTCHEAWWDVTCLIVPHSAPVWQVMFTLMYSDHFFHLLKHIVPCRSFRREKMLYLRILSKIEMILVYFFTVNEMHHQGGVSLAPDLFCSRTMTPNIQPMSIRTSSVKKNKKSPTVPWSQHQVFLGLHVNWWK